MEPWITQLFWISLLLLTLSIVYELLPTSVTEGFSGLVSVGDSKFWAKLVPRRGDVGPDLEQDGLLRDPRYFSGYADLQRFGQKTDFCRVVMKAGADEKDKFLACALGGTENLSSTSFRSPSVRDGFLLSRDDYMRDVDGNGLDDYCRIVKRGPATFGIDCNSATEKGFSLKLVPDNTPPETMSKLLNMYDGCIFWLRFRDDMVDYTETLYLNSAGGAKVAEKPVKPDVTEGLRLNGISQYLRLGDDPYLNLGSVVKLRSMRAFMFWVRFDEFTNNAHIFDFGNGAGIDNVWIGILNRGNQGLDHEEKPLLCGNPMADVLPDGPSGAQPGEVTTPQDLMETSDANVEAFTCEGFAVAPRKMPRTIPKAMKSKEAKFADLCFEIWDKDMRKMRIVVPMVFKKGEWTHITVTALDDKSFRPDIALYKNGQKVFVEPSGWLPQTDITEKNYIGKSNWSDVTSQYANKDELLQGAVFDFRGYQRPLSEKDIQESYMWGQGLLGLKKD